MFVAAGGERGGSGLALPTHKVGAAVVALAVLPIYISTATSSAIAPVGWMFDIARGKSQKHVSIFAEGDNAKGGQGHIPSHPLNVLYTEDMETLYGTGIGGDLPATVIPTPPYWYNHPSSAAGSATHIYDLGCIWGL